VHSNRPTVIPSIPQQWRTVELAIGKYHLIGVGIDGTLFGLGDNQLGQLGLCHTECVKRATVLTFLQRLNQTVTRRTYGRSVDHPLNTGYTCETNKCTQKGCKCDDECSGWEPEPTCEKKCDRSRVSSAPNQQYISYYRGRSRKYQPNERVVTKCNSRRCC